MTVEIAKWRNCEMAKLNCENEKRPAVRSASDERQVTKVTMDLVFEESGRSIVLDFKTDRELD